MLATAFLATGIRYLLQYLEQLPDNGATGLVTTTLGSLAFGWLGGKIGARVAGQSHADGDATFAFIQFGDIGIDVADSGHASGSSESTSAPTRLPASTGFCSLLRTST
mgnify:CR=1 FL=1